MGPVDYNAGIDPVKFEAMSDVQKMALLNKLASEGRIQRVVISTGLTVDTPVLVGEDIKPLSDFCGKGIIQGTGNAGVINTFIMARDNFPGDAEVTLIPTDHYVGPLVTITMENGQTLHCCPNSKIYMIDGIIKTADEVKKGDKFAAIRFDNNEIVSGALLVDKVETENISLAIPLVGFMSPTGTLLLPYTPNDNSYISFIVLHQ